MSEGVAGLAVAQGVSLGADVLERPHCPGEGDHGLGCRIGAGQGLPRGLGHVPDLVVLPGLGRVARPVELDLEDPPQLDRRPHEGIGGMLGRGLQAEQRVLGRPPGPVPLPVHADMELRREPHRPVELHQRPEKRLLLFEVERLAGLEAATKALQLPMVHLRPPLVVAIQRRAA